MGGPKAMHKGPKKKNDTQFQNRLQKLQADKKKNREMEKTFRSNWELGEDAGLYKKTKAKELSDSDISSNELVAPSKKKSAGRDPRSSKKHAKESPAPSRSSKHAKKIVSEEFNDLYLKGPSRNPPIENSNNNSSTSKAAFDHRTLEDWVLTYGGNANGRSVGYLKGEIDQDIGNRIGKKVKNPSLENETGNEKQTFGQDDMDDDPFGMNGPEEYAMFREMIHIEEIEKETLYRKTGRSFLSENKHFVPNEEGLEECDSRYCERYLRESRGLNFGERECKYGNRCIFMILSISYPDQSDGLTGSRPEDSFICREFLLPSQENAYKEENVLPDVIRPCLGCNRYRTTFWWYDHFRRGDQPRELLQDHYNTVGDNLETSDRSQYNIDSCIYPSGKEDLWMGICRPIIKFSASNYVYSHTSKTDVHNSSKNGTLKCVREANVGFH